MKGIIKMIKKVLSCILAIMLVFNSSFNTVYAKGSGDANVTVTFDSTKGSISINDVSKTTSPEIFVLDNLSDTYLISFVDDETIEFKDDLNTFVVKAIPNEGYKVSGWTLNGSTLDDDTSSYEDATIVPVFEPGVAYLYSTASSSNPIAKYTSLQEAINNASSGNAIEVVAETNNEDIVLPAGVTLFANDGYTGTVSTNITGKCILKDVNFGYFSYTYTVEDGIAITYKDQGDEDFSGTHEDGYPTMFVANHYAELKEASKKGYTFDGWFNNSSCTGDAVDGYYFYECDAPVTLYAKWTEKDLTVADILPNDFPTSSEAAWKSESGELIYLSSGSLITAAFNINTTSVLTKSDDNYTLSTGWCNVEFVMDGDKLDSIVISDAPELYSEVNGTYSVLKYNLSGTVSFPMCDLLYGGKTIQGSGQRIEPSTNVSITPYGAAMLSVYKYSITTDGTITPSLDSSNNQILKFVMPESDVSIEATFVAPISSLSLTLAIPKDGDTTIANATTTTSGIAVGNTSVVDSDGNPFSGTFEKGKTYYAIIPLTATNIQFKTLNPTIVLNNSLYGFDAYSFRLDDSYTKINGVSISAYTSSSSLYKSSGYYGGSSNLSPNNLVFVYEFTPYVIYQYEIGDKQVINIDENNDATFVSNADFSKFVRVEIDGETVDSSNYDASSGSTKIVLHSDYLKTLDLGVHYLSIISSDGSAETEFTITKSSKPVDDGDHRVPNTGESTQSVVSLPTVSYTTNCVAYIIKKEEDE